LVLIVGACKKDEVVEPEPKTTLEKLLGEWEIYEIFSPDNVINFGTGIAYEFGESYTSGIDIENDSTFYYLGVDQAERWELIQEDTFRLYFKYGNVINNYFIYRLDDKELWLSDWSIDGEFTSGTKFLKKD
jgi:hypothetical protein